MMEYRNEIAGKGKDYEVYIAIDSDDKEKIDKLRFIFFAGPDMYEALQLISEKYNRCVICKNLKENGHDYACPIGNSLAKAEGK